MKNKGPWIPSWLGFGIVELCASRLILLSCFISQRDNAKFLEFSEDCLSRTGRLLGDVSRSTHRVPCIIRHCTLAAGLFDTARNSQGSSGNVGCSRAAEFLRFVKISCIRQRSHLALLLLNLTRKLIHNTWTPLVIQRQFFNSWLSSFFCLFVTACS